MNHRPLISLTLFAAAIASIPPRAFADDGVVAEVPAAVPVSSPQTNTFVAGAMPSLAGFLSVSDHVSLGLRMRFGALGDGGGTTMGVADPGRGGLITGEGAVRVSIAGTWVELDAGGGATGHDGVPTWEVGVGHSFQHGRFAIGPMLRYLRVMGHDDQPMIQQGSAGIVLVGLELRVGSKPRVPHIIDVVADVPEPAPEADHDQVAEVEQSCRDAADPSTVGCALPDRDHDGIPDADDKCPDEAEVVNGVEDADGCPDQGLFQVENDRIVLEERILFEVNRARIRHGGKPVIEAIAAAWKAHPEWGHMVIEGHADVRGPDNFNEWLSQTRAARVKEALIGAGVPLDRVDSVGYGATRPRDPGTTEDAHQRNRRVEFVIVRDGGHQ